MKRLLCGILCLSLLFGCGAADAGGGGEGPGYQQITQEEAKALMDGEDPVVILDVREPSEFDQGHIPGAVLLPLGTIDEASAAEVIPEKDAVVLVYCRSGNRSKQASEALAELGYTGIREFGGIKDWPYEVSD